ncbi:MAG: divergent polysaccharide deacetylase family protein [Fibrobacteres bacterium]|nr:divergent polysaccharide deacetylase family protein [Fibrobacterota bacterium]
MAGPAMGVVRKLLIFIVLTAGLIALGRLAGRVLPHSLMPSIGSHAPADSVIPSGPARDSGDVLPAVSADTSGGRWHERLFDPLEHANGLGPKSLKRKPGYFEIILPKGKPLYEYALDIEKTCRARGIVVVQGAESRPSGKSVEYLLESNGQRIKLRASLGGPVRAGAARLAVVFIGLDSLSLSQAQSLKDADWGKTLVIDPYNPNPALRALRDGDGRDGILAELPMEPSAYPYVDPGKNALYIHHGKEDVDRILGKAMDSLPKAEGFASRYGDRAIENQPLLDKLFQFTARRRLVFLDLTGSQRSLARQAAAAQGARSRTLSPFRDSAHVEEELARKTALAQKSGEAVLVLPFSETGFRRLSKAIAAETPRFNEIGLELVDLASVSAPDTLPSEAGITGPKAESPMGAKTTSAAAKPASGSKAPAKGLPKTPANPPATISKAPGGAKPVKGKTASPVAGKAPAKASAKPAGAKPPAKPSAGATGARPKEKRIPQDDNPASK